MNCRLLTVILMCCALSSCSTAVPPPRPATLDDRRAALAYISEQASDCDGVELYDGAYLTRARPIFGKLVDAAGLNKDRISLHVIDCANVVNALSVNSTAVVIFTALADRTRNEDELAFVIGHELAHIALGHTSEEPDDSVASLLGGIGFDSDDEAAADRLAVRLLTAAGYNGKRGALLRERAASAR